jgi:hypothetical protein
MYIVLNTLVYDEKDLHIFILKINAMKYLASMSSPKDFVILDINFKFVNDIKDYLKKLFKVEKKIIEPVLATSVQQPIQEPVQQPVQEPVVTQVQATIVQEVKAPADYPIDETK